jgi:excisionase family DNA binding protein
VPPEHHLQAAQGKENTGLQTRQRLALSKSGDRPVDPEEAGTPAAEVTMSPRKGKKGTGRRATPSALSPGADIEMMTLRQVAQYLNCSYATAHKLAQQGKIPSFKLGGSWRFLKSEIDKWIAKGGGRK